MSSHQPETTAPAAGSTGGGGTIKNARHRTSPLKQCYHLAISNALYLLLAPAVAISLLVLSTATANPPLAISLLVLSTVLATAYLMRRRRAVYLLDFACYKPGPEHVVTRERFMRQSEAAGVITPDNLAFQRKILERSGLGQGTYFPSAVLNVPPNPCMAEARAEAEAVMFGAIDQVLAKTGVRARDIGVVVVNCSLFNPTPSLSAMIINKYKLRSNIRSFNLSGMGCSAGLISIDLARDMLQVIINK